MAKEEYEKNVKKLDELVEELDRGELSLDEAIAKYKSGIELSKKCYQQLQTTEKEVNQLLIENDQLKESKFE